MPIRTKAERAKYQLHFDRKKIFIIRNGQKINAYDEIQANNIDTDIYKVIEKYHGDEKTALEQMKTNIPLMYGEFKNLDLKDVENGHKRALEMWNDLPLQVREKFHNNQNEFIKNGEEWLKTELEKLQPQPQPEPQPEPDKKGDK